MADVEIPKELYEEAKSDPFVGKRLGVNPGHRPLAFINEDGEVVGFQTPGVSKIFNKPMTGSIYIAQKHRRNGYATQALASFLREHEDGISYVRDDNQASRAAHAKAGWSDTGKSVTGHKRATVWAKAKKESAMHKTASQIATAVLYKLGFTGVKAPGFGAPGGVKPLGNFPAAMKPPPPKPVSTTTGSPPKLASRLADEVLRRLG